MNLACTILGLWCSISGPATAIDGDTLDIKGTRVRLWGIDAPELNEPLGLQSKDELAQLLRKGPITCYEVSFRSYSRRVSQCFSGDTDVGEHIVHSGLALDCKRFSGGHYRNFEPPHARYQITQKPYC